MPRVLVDAAAGLLVDAAAATPALPVGLKDSAFGSGSIMVTDVESVMRNRTKQKGHSIRTRLHFMSACD